MPRRGSIGDDSSNDFSDSGYDNDTTAGTGSTGDDSDNDFGSGGSDVDSGGETDTSSDADSGGFDGGDDGSDYDSGSDYDADSDSGVTGDDDDDTTYSGGGSSTTAGSGVTGDTDTTDTETRRLRDDAESDPVNPQTERTEIATDDGGQTTFEGGQSAQNDPYADKGLTGTDDPADADRGTSITETPSGETVVEDESGTRTEESVQVGETSERGVGVTRGSQGGTTQVVIPKPERDVGAADSRGTESPPERAVTASTQRQRDARSGDEARSRIGSPQTRDLSPGEMRAIVTRYGQRQLSARTPVESSAQPIGPLDYAVDAAFQNSEEVAGFFGLTSPAAREDRVDVGGPAFVQGDDFGRRDPVDTSITDQLTAGRGRFSEQQERELQADIEARREFFGIGSEADEFVTSLTGNARAGDFARGVGQTPGDFAAAPAAATLAYDTATEVAANLPETVQKEGIGDVADAGVDTAGAALAITTQQAKRNPYRFAGNIAGEIVTGTALLRAGSRAGRAGRSIRSRAQADETIDLADITNDQGAKGELPNFETGTSAPTKKAVAEVQSRAAETPTAVSGAVGTERVLYHSTEADLGDAFEAARGSSELPGLFTSPDASPLRLQESSSASLSRPRLPRLSDFTGGSDRFAAFEGDRIEGMPDDATGSGRVPDGDGGYEPDPSTSGAQFLDEQAEEGTAYVRPTGSRTTELESIFPPGSSFETPRETVGTRLERRSLASEPMTSRDVFGRPLRQDVGGEIASEPMTSRDVFGRPLRQDVGAEIASEPSTSRDVFGRPLASDVGERSISERVSDSLPGLSRSSSPTTSRDVFGRPIANEVGATPISERISGALPSASEPMGSRDVFGRPIASDVGATPLSERVPQQRDLFAGATSSAEPMTSRDVFGRPLASDVGERSFSDRISGALPSASEPMTSRDVFGRPLRSDVTRPAGQQAVKLPSGRTIPMDVYRRADDANTDADRGASVMDPGTGGERRSARSIADEYSRRRRRSSDLSGSPVAPPLALGSSVARTTSEEPSLSATLSSPPSAAGGAERTSAVRDSGLLSDEFVSGGSGRSSQSAMGSPSATTPLPSGPLTSSGMTDGLTGSSSGGSETTPSPVGTQTPITPTISGGSSNLSSRRGVDDDLNADDDRDLVDVSGWATKEQRDLQNPFTGR